MKSIKNYSFISTIALLALTTSTHAAITFYDGRPGTPTTSPILFEFTTTSIFGDTLQTLSTENDPAQPTFAFQDNFPNPDTVFTVGTSEITPFREGFVFDYHENSSFTGINFLLGATQSSGNFTTGYTGINYALINSNPDDDDTYDTVGAFFLSDDGNSSLIALASTDDGSEYTITQAAQDMAAASGGNFNLQAIPEPTSLILLSLTSTTLTFLRRRN